MLTKSSALEIMDNVTACTIYIIELSSSVKTGSYNYAVCLLAEHMASK